MNPRAFDQTFRIAFGFLNAVLAVRLWEYGAFREIETAGALSSDWYHACCAFWLLGACLLAAGLRPALSSAFILLGVNVVFDTSVGADLLKQGAFFALFLPPLVTLRGSKPFFMASNTPTRVWPYLLLVMTVGMNIFFAGLSKIFDPVWSQGWGFYYTFLQPWIKPDWLSPLLDVRLFVVAANYAGIILELAILPLLLFRRTRPWGLALFGAFFCFLTFPLRIDPIGPVGLVLFVGGLTTLSPPEAGRRRIFYALSVIMLVIGSSTALREACQFQRPYLKSPFFSGSPVRPSDNRVCRVNRKLFKNLQMVNAPLFSLGWYAPFNMKHFLGRYIYRVELFDGREWKAPHQPYDQRGRATGHESCLMCPSVVRNRSWNISSLAHKAATGAGPGPRETALVRAIFSYYGQGGGYRRGRLSVLLLSVPAEYGGDARLWEGRPWEPLVDYDFQTGVMSTQRTAPYVPELSFLGFPLQYQPLDG